MQNMIERLVFASRWLQVPLYLGLAISLIAVGIRFFAELFHIGEGVLTLEGPTFALALLGLIDLVLIANLIIMVLIAGYENFVAPLEREGKSLNWLGKLDSGSLKIKLAGSIVAISSIHLLAAFMDAQEIANDKLVMLVVMHLTFVTSALLLALTDKIAFGAKGH
jgi:uncharacterized protein (TIGR00645 family)